MGSTVSTTNGRTLMFETWGASSGKPVFLLHGTPGSRVGPHPRHSVLYWLGIRLICPDRPGYGGSDSLPGRTVAHVAADVAAIADHLGLDRFAVVGRSGGGPHALACAALLPERVTRAAVLVSPAPRDAAGLDWYAGMTPANIDEYRSAESGYEILAPRISAHAHRIRQDPIGQLPFDPADLPVPDRKVVGDYTIRSMLYDNFTEALKDSGVGWADDAYSFVQPWGFNVSEVERPVLLWHGVQDVFAPAHHTCWLGANLPDAQLVLDEQAAHFGALVVLTRVLNWAAKDELARF